MGLFKKKKKNETSTAAPDISNIREGLTLLGRNLSIKGTVSGKDDVQLLGDYVGDFDLNGNLNIHQSASIAGNVKANNISVAGTVQGNLTATKKINIFYTADIKGDIRTPVISIQEGAQFNGKVDMNAT